MSLLPASMKKIQSKMKALEWTQHFPHYNSMVAMETSGRIWSNFELIQALIHVLITCKYENQRTNGPVNAHLISWPSKAQNIQNLENIWKRNDLDLQYSHTFIISISCLHLPTFRSQAAIVSEKTTVFTFSHRKA